MQFIASLITVSAIFLVSGCQASSFAGETPVEKMTPTRVVPSPQGDIEMTTSLPVPTDPGLQNLIGKAKEDLAGRIAVTADEISLIEITEVEWSDSSLGCPQPGMSYLQVITPGYLIVLEANSQTYEYHSNRDSYFAFCENLSPPSFPKP
jgi:hypothetical protein